MKTYEERIENVIKGIEVLPQMPKVLLKEVMSTAKFIPYIPEFSLKDVKNGIDPVEILTIRARKTGRVQMAYVCATKSLIAKWHQNKAFNRKITPAVKEFAKLCEEGNLVINNNLIAFDEEGKEYDGQHRTCGFLLSNQESQIFLIAVGFPKDFKHSNTDVHGKRRTTSDQLSIVEGKHCESLVVKIMNGAFKFSPETIAGFTNGSSFDYMEVLGLYEKFGLRGDMMWVTQLIEDLNVPKTKKGPIALFANIFRARHYFKGGDEKLERFIKILLDLDEPSNSSDHWPVVLRKIRDYSMDHEDGCWSGGGDWGTRRRMYRVINNILFRFMNGERCSDEIWKGKPNDYIKKWAKDIEHFPLVRK